ncbi:histone-lysine N-methyltransferase [Candidatus Margulisiibacteriota bacterium]
MSESNNKKTKWLLNEKKLGKNGKELPNLLRGMFPYSEVPKIAFDEETIPLNPPKDIWITDTTFRDGQQARPPYTVEEIVNIFKLLNKLGGPNGIIRQSEFFLYSEKDREAVRECQELGYEFPHITGWIRAVKSDFQLVKEMGLKETGILTSASDYHIFLKLKKDRKQAMEAYLDVVKSALDEGIVPRCHLEDITRADFYGFVIPFVQELMKLSKKYKIPIKVRACDTMGYGVPFPEASLPRSVPKLIHKLVKEGGVPPEQLEWHGHNDFHKVLVNGTTAWLYGCCAANGTVLGFGERTGNPPIEALIIDYISLTGKTNGIETKVITEIADYFQKEIGVSLPKSYPFVGDDFNTTRAGIHADGLIKNQEIYNIFDTEKILDRPMGVSITDKSGAAGVVYWLNDHLRLKGSQRLLKNHPAIQKIVDWVTEQYKIGRTTAISPEEMTEQGRVYLPEYFESDFAKLRKKAEIISKHLIADLVEEKSIKSMDPQKQEQTLTEFIKESPFIQFMYVVGVNGSKVTKNITQAQDSSAFQKLPPDENYANRSWFKNTVKKRAAYVSKFYTSKLTNRLCITVAAPIKNKKGKILGLLGADIKFEDIVNLGDK